MIQALLNKRFEYKAPPSALSEDYGKTGHQLIKYLQYFFHAHLVTLK